MAVPSSDACTPLPAVAWFVPAGSTMGGQMPVQLADEVHVTFPPFSPTRTYRVRLLPSTSTVPTP